MTKKEENPSGKITRELEALLAGEFGIDRRIIELVRAAEERAGADFTALDEIKKYNQYKVTAAFQKNRVSDTHFAWNTGYG